MPKSPELKRQNRTLQNQRVRHPTLLLRSDFGNEEPIESLCTRLFEGLLYCQFLAADSKAVGFILGLFVNAEPVPVRKIQLKIARLFDGCRCNGAL